MKRWELLAGLIDEHDVRVMVEVGSFDGRNVGEILRRCRDLTVFCVDDWRPQYKRDAKAMAESEAAFDAVRSHYRHRMVKVRKPSVYAARNFSDLSVGLVFIDASHEREDVAADLAAWEPKVASGGVIAGHDYASERHPGVTEAVDAFFGVDAVQSMPEDGTVSSVWWRRR